MHLSFVRCLGFASLLLIFSAFPVSETRAQASAPGADLTAASPVTIRTIAHAIASSGLAVDSQNRVYFASANRVFRVSALSNGSLELVAGNGERGSLGDGGPAIAAQLNLLAPFQRVSLAIDADDNLYILDAGNETIRRVNAATDIISTVVGHWAHSPAASNYPATGDLAFAPPSDSAASGRLFFVSAGNLVSGDLARDVFSILAPLSSSIRGVSGARPSASSAAHASLALSTDDANAIYFACSAGLFSLPASVSSEPSAPAKLLLQFPILRDPSSSALHSVPTSRPLDPAAGEDYSLAVSPAGELYLSQSLENFIARVDPRTLAITPLNVGTLNSPGPITFDHAGNLFFIDTADNAIREIELAASGSVSLFPTRYPFATQLVGGQTPPHTFMLTNGTAGTISGLTVQFVGGANPPDFVQTNTCGSQLGPSQTCKIDVSFAPQASGQRTAILSVTDSDPSSPQTAELTGFADDFTLGLQDGATDTLTVVAGGKATFNLLATSDSSFSGKVIFHCPNDLPLYVTCAVNPPSDSLAPGSPQKFTAVFQTTTRVSSFVPVLPAPAGPNSPRSKLLIPLFAFSTILTLIWFFAPRPAAHRKLRLAPVLFAASALIAFFAIAACGKKSTTTSTAGGIGTVAGTYTFTVTASAQNATRAISLTLTVQ